MRLVRVAGAALLLTAALASPALAGLPTSDVSITKVDTPDPVVAGGNITWTITVQNTGSSAATDLAVIDAIPAGLPFISFTTPAGWTANTPPVGGMGSVMATAPTLAASGTATFTLVVETDLADLGTITNTASVTSSSPDANPANNSATAMTSVAAAATPAPTPQASLADAAMVPSSGSQLLAILGFAVLLVGVLGASAVLAVRRART